VPSLPVRLRICEAAEAEENAGTLQNHQKWAQEFAREVPRYLSSSVVTRHRSETGLRRRIGRSLGSRSASSCETECSGDPVARPTAPIPVSLSRLFSRGSLLPSSREDDCMQMDRRFSAHSGSRGFSIEACQPVLHPRPSNFHLSAPEHRHGGREAQRRHDVRAGNSHLWRVIVLVARGRVPDTTANRVSVQLTPIAPVFVPVAYDAGVVGRLGRAAALP
jgi:hypothetical protein